jgi:acetylornithine/N-succinyldiaminopimelate aminotransferase
LELSSENERVADVFSIGTHGSTFGGNPVACSAGCEVIKELSQIVEKIISVGNYLKEKLEGMKLRHPIIKEVRGVGLMIGVELSIECSEIVRELLNKGVIANCTSNNVVRLLPPLIINESEVDFFIEKFDEVLSEIKQQKFKVQI